MYSKYIRNHVVIVNKLVCP